MIASQFHPITNDVKLNSCIAPDMGQVGMRSSPSAFAFRKVSSVHSGQDESCDLAAATYQFL